MTEQQRADVHLSLEEFLDYYSSRLLADREEAIEQHLAACDACTQLGRQVYAATLLLNRWSKGDAKSKAARRILYPALSALVQKATDAALRQRLEKWADAWSGRADGALRMVIESSNKASRIITEGMEDLLRPGARWQFALSPVHTPVRGESEADTVCLAMAPGTSQARVAVSGQSGEVEVRVDNLPSGQQPPLVIVVPLGHRSEPRIGEMRRSPGVPYWIARFEGVESGEYLVLLEPMSD